MLRFIGSVGRIRFPAMSFLCVCLTPRLAEAEWLPNGIPIGVADLAQVTDDGHGGAFIGWRDLSGPSLTLTLSHLESGGAPAESWPPFGLPLFPYPFIGSPPLFVFSDGNGGALVLNDAIECAASCGVDPHELLAQHVRGDGLLAPGWTARGVPVSEPGYEDDFYNHDGRHTTASSDERGGFVAAWSHVLGPPPPGPRSGGGPVELHAQRVDGSGKLVWGSEAVMVRSATSLYTFSQAVAPDGEGGAFIFWADARPPGIYGQHISARGGMLWATDGIPIARTTTSIAGHLLAVPDGAHGAILTWAGVSKAGAGIFAARVNRRGLLAWPRDVTIMTSTHVQADFRMGPAEDGGAIVSWRDTLGDTPEVIRAQRVNHRGRTLWTDGGTSVSQTRSRKNSLAMAADHHRGAYIAWGDSRTGGEVFAIHIDESGEPVSGWLQGGSPVAAQAAALHSVQMSEDGDAGAILVWIDARQVSDTILGSVVEVMKLGAHGPATPPPLPASSAQAPIQTERKFALTGGAVFALHGGRPNPGPGSGAILFSLPGANPATLRLFDIAGRVLWSRDVGTLGPGEHELPIDGGMSLAPGVYFARLQQGSRASTARITIVR